MTTGIEKLERKFDRLEKLFPWKRKEAASLDIAVLESRPITPIPLSPTSGADAQTFPRPSFIRPTSSRMVAREEVAFGRDSMRRARSLPESSSSRSLVSTVTQAQGDKAATDSGPLGGCPEIPQRLSSLGPGIPQRSSSLSRSPSRIASLAQLLEFGFPAAHKKGRDSSSGRRSTSGSKSVPRSTSVSVSQKAQVNRKRCSGGVKEETPISRPHCPDDKCPSVQSTRPSKSMQPHDEGKHSGVVRQESRAQQILPERVTLPKTQPHEINNDNVEKSHTPRSMSTSRTVSKPALRISTSFPALSGTAGGRFILKEPSFSEFLTLSDDDIAGDRAAPRVQPAAPEAPSYSLPPNPPAVIPPARITSAYPLLTPSPPLASRPAAAAAFEAARIAVKFKFDLIYVVNLWPAHMSRSQRQFSPRRSPRSTPTTPTTPTRAAAPSEYPSPASDTSTGEDSLFGGRIPRCNDGTSQCGMTGRLLAAYGLPSIMCPFRISAPVHQKVLRTQGWLEYRNDNTGPSARDEFARGYSCSFYTGYSPDKRRCDAPSPGSGKQEQRGRKTGKAASAAANRGVVFAAYRLPRGDGTGVRSDAAELAALHKEAEFLVDMLIDVHMTERKRRAAAAAATAPKRCVGAKGLPKVGAALLAV
ncbi:UspA domain-containing protein [Madurella fahalii]|uniref:UspA domain-containing protein n=1 Tax=Madurella fahalii TaxID=1157608 RepID=A0ABQ0FZ57_9PEZI